MSTAAETTVSDRFLKRPEVARLLGVCDKTLRSWERSGKLPTPIEVNGRFYYRQSAVRAFLAGKEAPSA